MRPALEAADRLHARGLAILAPAITDEALVTLLVNDLLQVFRAGIVPLELHAAPDEIDALLARVSEAAGAAVWDGRPAQIPLGYVARLVANCDTCLLRFGQPTQSSGGLLARANRLLRRAD